MGRHKNKLAELSHSRVKFSFRRHIMPPLGGLLVAFLFFGFFNSQLISGQIAYYVKQHQHVKVPTVRPPAVPSVSLSVIDKNAPSKVVISKTGAEAPVVYDLTTVDEADFQEALKRGVVHYPGTAVPGERGNVVLFGHSSGQWWAPGDYKFIFSLLDKLTEGDEVSVDYQGIRYVYKVTGMHVVLSDDLSVLDASSTHKLTLITCTPVGTNRKRLVVEAEQISPAITQTVSVQKPVVIDSGKLPSSAPSFWQNVKDLLHL